MSLFRLTKCPEETAGTLYTGGVVSEGLCALPAGTSVQTPVRTGPPVYKVGPCALGGTFRRDFAQCPKAGGDFAHWRHRFGGGLHTAGGNQCADPRPDRVASVQSRAVCTGAARTGTRAMPRGLGVMVPRGNSGVTSREPTRATCRGATKALLHFMWARRDSAKRLRLRQKSGSQAIPDVRPALDERNVVQQVRMGAPPPRSSP